jgi:predicted phage terminase large subunit-like protein
MGGIQMANRVVLAPQKGPQETFLATSADICIYGGAAGGGKTYGLLLEGLRHMNNPNFNAVIFRRNYTQVTSPGGLWDSSKKIYSQVKGCYPLKTPKLHWTFKKGATVNFAHLASDDDCLDWQGSQITMIGFDELTHFSEYQFFYMMSRNRTDSGVSPYIRATCNPDADSWVANFIKWWIDQDSGYPIKERSGKIRWMIRLNEEIHWVDSREEAVELAMKNGIERIEAETMPKSVTFIASTLQDNKILMHNDPGYLANLKALPEVERERLLKGNWKIKAAAGLFFKRTQVGHMLEELPKDIIMWARGWDLAATDEDEDGDPAYTAGVLIGKTKEGRYVVADVINQRLEASKVRALIKQTCQIDKSKYGRVIERLPQDPGQAGKAQAQSFIKFLSGFLVKCIPESGSKESRAEPFAAQWQPGNVDVLIAPWNEVYFNQLESFPESKFKDMVDGSSSAFNELENGATYSAPPKSSSLGKNSYWRK